MSSSLPLFTGEGLGLGGFLIKSQGLVRRKFRCPVQFIG